MSLAGTVRREEVLWALGSLCGLDRLPFDSGLVAQQFPPPYTVGTFHEAARTPGANGGPHEKQGAAAGSTYKALVVLKAAQLQAGGESFPLSAGMQANAEILLGTRTVLEYLLSPVQKAWHEAGRER